VPSRGPRNATVKIYGIEEKWPDRWSCIAPAHNLNTNIVFIPVFPNYLLFVFVCVTHFFLLYDHNTTSEKTLITHPIISMCYFHKVKKINAHRQDCVCLSACSNFSPLNDFDEIWKLFNVENFIIRGCKWNEAVSNRNCNNLWLMIPSLLSNRSSVADFVTLEMCKAKHVDGSGHIASETR
jgi:hypothetical protein